MSFKDLVSVGVANVVGTLISTIFWLVLATFMDMGSIPITSTILVVKIRGVAGFDKMIRTQKDLYC